MVTSPVEGIITFQHDCAKRFQAQNGRLGHQQKLLRGTKQRTSKRADEEEEASDSCLQSYSSLSCSLAHFPSSTVGTSCRREAVLLYIIATLHRGSASIAAATSTSTFNSTSTSPAIDLFISLSLLYLGMEQPPPGPAPTDPYQWRESVLSTRSLSYISTVPDDYDPAPSSPRRIPLIRNASFGYPNFSFTRRNTLMSISSLGEDEETLEIVARKPQQHLQNQNSSSSPSTGQTTPEPRTAPETPQPTELLPVSIASSRLFALPRELRLLIWSYALSPSDPTLEIPWPSTHLHASLQPQLLRVCKPIYAESSEILYTTTNLSFAHPSDANIFRRALASQELALLLPHFTIRVKSTDAKLWTNYFNSHSQERSLVKDFPSLQSLSIRYQGLRYDRRFTEDQNAHLWLKDPRLQEVVLSVRRCSVDGHGGGPPVVRVTLCVVLPEEVKRGLVERVDAKAEAERCTSVIYVREAWLLGCYIRVQAVDKDGQWS